MSNYFATCANRIKSYVFKHLKLSTWFSNPPEYILKNGRRFDNESHKTHHSKEEYDVVAHYSPSFNVYSGSKNAPKSGESSR